jgi:hypothetical protein
VIGNDEERAKENGKRQLPKATGEHLGHVIAIFSHFGKAPAFLGAFAGIPEFSSTPSRLSFGFSFQRLLRTFAVGCSFSQRHHKESTIMSDNETAFHKAILKNQAEILKNQATIKKNQQDIKANQKKLDQILTNQKSILANQKKILAK